VRRPQARSLPSRVVHAVPNCPSSENIIGINLSLERLADLALHRQCAIRTDISLKRRIDSTVIYLELRETFANGHSLWHHQIRALRKALPGTRTCVLDDPWVYIPSKEVVVLVGDPGADWAAETAAAGGGGA